jgi:hypothetical protein
MVTQLADSTNSDNTLILNDPNSVDTITINGGPYTIDTTAIGGYYSTASMNYGNITISNGGSSASPWNSGYITTAGTNTPSLQVTGDAEFGQDIKIKGVSVLKTLDEINKRLAILVPDPDKLEHFEALKKAYDHYKTLEALCQLPKKESE